MLRTVCVVLFCICFPCMTDTAAPVTLVFGGNGFIGSEVVKHLIELGHDLYLVNRGSWYFDSKTRIQAFVKNIECDRDELLEGCEPLVDMVRAVKKFDYVIDFTCFIPVNMEDAIAFLKPRAEVGLYIYISTDSVYEVCEKKKHDGPLKESDAVPPADPEQKKKYAQRDTYGFEKLMGEVVLRQQREAGGYPFVFLRLPDVLGPRDNTKRWWTYQMWVKFYKEIHRRISVPPEVENLRTSYVYVKDVAQAVVKVMEKGSSVYDQAFNLGFDRDFTLWEIVSGIAEEMGLKWIQADNTDDDSIVYFPSVSRGPLDISKAKRMLDYKPTEWAVALKETVAYYEWAFHNEALEREKVISKVQHYVVPAPNRGKFLDAVKKALQSSEAEDVAANRVDL